MSPYFLSAMVGLLMLTSVPMLLPAGAVTNSVPHPPTEGPPAPVLHKSVSYWSDGTTTTNSFPFEKTTNLPTQVTMTVVYLDTLTGSTNYMASFTTEYKPTGFMKTEIREE